MSKVLDLSVVVDRSTQAPPVPKAIVFDFFEEYSAALVDFTSEDFVVHRKLLGVGLPLVEQATNLASVGQERFTIHAPFFKLDAAEAAPCRVFAILDT